jgi:hypothetical protein
MCSYSNPYPTPPTKPTPSPSTPSSKDFCSMIKQSQQQSKILDDDSANCLCTQCGDKFPMAYQSFSKYISNPEFKNDPLKTAQSVLQDNNISSFIKCATDCTDTTSSFNVAVCSLGKYQNLPNECRTLEHGNIPNNQCKFKMVQMLNDCIKEVGSNKSS